MKWHPKSIVALILGSTILVIVLLSGALELIHVEVVGKESPEAIGAWKEIMMAIVGGLLAWIGGRDGGED